MVVYFQKCCGSLSEVSRARETWIGAVSHVDASVLFVMSWGKQDVRRTRRKRVESFLYVFSQLPANLQLAQSETLEGIHGPSYCEAVLGSRTQERNSKTWTC